jgi:PAS domain S-box-containing protein
VRVHKDGRRIPVSIRISPIVNAEGEIVGASGIDRDITQQKLAERRRNVRLAVTQILAEEPSVEQATARILEAVCTTLEWSVGCFWRWSAIEEVLQCGAMWRHPAAPCESFETACRQFVFPKGASLPGRVWLRGAPIWIADVDQDPEFARAPQAKECGLHGALACPVTASDQFLGVFEFFSREPQEPDEDLLEMMGTLGAHFGQFIERRRAEQDLEHTHRLLRNVLDNTPAIIYVKDHEGRQLLVNRQFAELVGRPMNEIVGRVDSEVFGDHLFLKQIAANDRTVLETGQTHEFEEQLHFADGVRVYRSVKAPAEGIGYPGRVVIGISIDITRQKRQAATLRFLADASASLATLVDYKSTLQRVARLAVPDFADWCVVDMVEPDGRVERLAVAHVDPAKVQLAEEYARRYPHRDDDARGLAFVLRTSQPDMMTEIPEELLEAGVRDQEQLRLLRQLGLKSYLCVPLKARNRVLGVMTFVSAESGRRYTADDLAVAEDLAHRATIAIENARLYQEVREADRRKDEFLAMLSHELRNPLAPICTGLEVLALEGRGDRETVQLMQEQVEHLVRLVDDLLDVSRIIRGRIELRKEPVELATILRRAIETLRLNFDHQQQSLVVSAPKESIWLHADPVRLVQVVGNVLNNASKYTDRGGRIELSAERAGGEAVIRVRDNGVGIEPELLPKVFDLFTQASRSLDRSQGGLGIGLTLVRSLVEMHGGTVSAHSEGPGRGSEFMIRLPAATAPHSSKPEWPSAGSNERLRILVVDDNVGAAQMLSVLLTTLGPHEVEIAFDGPSALKTVEQFRPEIVFLDIGLPGMDGYRVGAALRRNMEFSPTVLVALTGYGQDEDRRRSREAGFDEHLVKPPSLKSIEAILAHPKLAK